MADNPRSRIVTLAARPESARVARNLVHDWLRVASWPDDLIDDVVYAVNEAVTNAVEHAYTASANVRTIGLSVGIEHGRDGTRRARVSVSDQGRWRPPPANHGFRGHGLKLMQDLMDEVIVQPGDGHHTGTVTMLLSPPVPALPRQAKPPHNPRSRPNSR